MSETFSFLRLSEVIQAKLDRRLSLQAAIAEIDAEFREAHALLSSIPSIGSLALVKRKREPKREPYFTPKHCARCAKVENMGRNGTLCHTCRSTSASDRMKRVVEQRKAAQW